MHRDIGQTSSDYSYIMGQWSIACMNTKVFLTDSSPRQAAQSTITVFMVGDKGAGKSTLTKALMTEKAGIIRWTGRVSKVSGVKEKTADIECHTIHSSRIGSLTLAGHRENHNSHDTVISSISVPSSGIFLFVVDLGAALHDLKRTISYRAKYTLKHLHS